MNKKLLAFWALFGIIFIDGVGMGIIFPLLVPIFWDPHLSILPSSVDANWHSVWYGITLSVFPLGLFFSAPMLGDLSDGYGRKKILIYAISGVGIAYLLSAFAVIGKSLALLIISRLIAGLLSGCQPIAQAATMDLSEQHEKPKNLSLIFLASSAGFAIGPMLGGMLSNSHWISWFNLSTPLFLAAIACFACCYLLKNFQETLTQARAIQFRPLRSFYVLKEVWQNQFIRVILLVLFFFQLSWGGFFQVVPAIAAKQYHFSTSQIGYYSSLMALGFGIAFLGSIDYLSKRFALKKVVLACLSVYAIGMLLALAWHQAIIMWLIAVPLGFCVATVYVLLSTLGSNHAGANYQGWFMGASMSTGAIAWFVAPLINSVLLNWHLFVPIMFSCLALVATLIIYLKAIYNRNEAN